MPIDRLKFIPPCRAIAAKSPPKGEQWVHEAKWDGYRIQIVKEGRTVRLFSRGGTEWTKRLPVLAGAFLALPARSAVLDGELCFTDQSGTPDFRALHRTMHVAQPDQERLIVYAFDLMHRNGADLRGKTLHERRRRLLEIAEPGRVPCLFIGDQYADGAVLLKQCERFRLEGVVSKRLDSPYVSGETRSWLKSKCKSWKDRNRERWRMFEAALPE